MYHPLPNRFKDYISTPKPNGYQSLHTTVIGHEGIPFEVQIRTRQMDEQAEYGVAAHWKYKEGIGGHDKLDERLAWVRQLLENQRVSEDSGNLLHDLKSDLLPEEVFAFTPKGDVINLPAGATCIDFAYAIHSAVGNRMVGCKVNNRMVPIDHVVATGEIIEVILGPADKGPSRDWLKIVKTSEAKSKIRNWFKRCAGTRYLGGPGRFGQGTAPGGHPDPGRQAGRVRGGLLPPDAPEQRRGPVRSLGYGGITIATASPSSKRNTRSCGRPRTRRWNCPRWTCARCIPPTGWWWRALTIPHQICQVLQPPARGTPSSASSPGASGCPSTRPTASNAMPARRTRQRPPLGQGLLGRQRQGQL